jgi:hypothetical protein
MQEPWRSRGRRRVLLCTPPAPRLSFIAPQVAIAHNGQVARAGALRKLVRRQAVEHRIADRVACGPCGRSVTGPALCRFACSPPPSQHVRTLLRLLLLQVLNRGVGLFTNSDSEVIAQMLARPHDAALASELLREDRRKKSIDETRVRTRLLERACGERRPLCECTGLSTPFRRCCCAGCTTTRQPLNRCVPVRDMFTPPLAAARGAGARGARAAVAGVGGAHRGVHA